MADRKKEEISSGISTDSAIEILNMLSSAQKAVVLEHLKTMLKSQKEVQDIDAVPVSIFSSGKISALEAISKYLKEDAGLEFKKIGKLLGRNEVTIRTSYKRALKKLPGRLDLSNYSLVIPIELFRDRNFSVLEIIVTHLHDHYKVSFKEIARLLCRNYKTVWTVYSKRKRKDAGR